MDFTPLSDATHVSASFYLNSAEAPFPEINVICRLEATTEIPELAVEYTGELFGALCDAFDADVFGVSLPLPEAWAASEGGIGALIGFELLPVVGSDPVARMAEMIAHVAAELPAELTSPSLASTSRSPASSPALARRGLLVADSGVGVAGVVAAVRHLHLVFLRGGEADVLVRAPGADTVTWTISDARC